MMEKMEVSGTPPAVAFKSVKTKKIGPQDGVGGAITSQLRSIKRGTRSEISYVGVEASEGTVMPILRHGDATCTVN